MRPLIASVLVAVASATTAASVGAQVDPPPEPGAAEVVVIPGARYDAGSTHRGLFGAGYRDLWTTPIRVPVVDLGELGGGVTPNRRGGGLTTKTLHLDGSNGRRYVFRSVDKAPIEFEFLRGSLLEGIVQDQVSSFHPTGAPVVAHLSGAVGVLHTEPTYMVVPDDLRLGEFRSDFVGLLVLVEERPADGPRGSAGFAGSTRIVQTSELFDALEEDPDDRVDAEGLLRARLVDLLVGDRDRSHNNHLWARFDEANGGVWRVIPRDRDQAFVRFDGFLKSVARSYERRLVSFEEAYGDVFALTRNAWDIDRRLLVGLDRDRWDAIVDEVQRTLTDRVLEEAVRQMPPEHVALRGDELTNVLRMRRDHLRDAAAELYRVVFSVPDISGTDADERLRVTRDGQDRVTVELSLLHGDGAPTYRRVFTAEETTEIRIFLHGGDDEVVLDGGGSEAIRVRIMGGGGRDDFRDEGWASTRRTILYDGDSATRFPPVGSARIRRSSPGRALSWFEGRRDLDWGTLTVPEPTVSFDGDRGLVVSPGLKYERYGFARQPYASRLRVRAGWSFGLGEPLLDLRYLSRDAFAGADVRLRFRWSGMEIINFYGFGNETVTTEPKSFHRVAHDHLRGVLAVGIGDGDRTYLDVGPTFTYLSTDTATANSFIARTNPYGAGHFTYAGVGMSFGVDARDHRGTPTRGYRIEGGWSVSPALFDAVAPFQSTHVELAGYMSPPSGNPVLAVRAAGKKVWGTFPFGESAFLGGSKSVRSLREQRYAGDATALGSAELRVKAFRMVFPVPSDVGFYLLADAGKVFFDGAPSDRIHSAVGVGLWLGLVNRFSVARLSVARGAGRTALNAGIGFIF